MLLLEEFMFELGYSKLSQMNILKQTIYRMKILKLRVLITLINLW